MSSSALDLVVITFNCGKQLIDVGIFATHVQSVFGDRVTAGLADVVVISLQEVAPLRQAFIGDYLLDAYLTRFDEAINLAAAQHVSQQASTVGRGGTQEDQKPYTLVKAHNVGYTAILLFARDASRLTNIQQAEVGFGTAGMGNKGAVGLRTVYADEAKDTKEQQSTELTFVATHLAAMEWNLELRNANWEAIMRDMTFGDPKELINKAVRSSSNSSYATLTEEEQHMLLGDEQHDTRLEQQLHDMSIFKPSSHLFVAGDLNYRISTTSPGPDAVLPSLDAESENYWPAFWPLDQLTRERDAGRTLHGLTEPEVRFAPTYKYVVEKKQSACINLLPWRQEEEDGEEQDGHQDEDAELAYSFAPHRYPSWTDRILYLDLPPWVKARRNAPRITVHAYDALPLMRSSDHRPVYMRVDVPLISPEDLTPPPGASLAETDRVDPRVQLPVEIDVDAWQRRQAARHKEQMLAWSMFLWGTRQGLWVLATLLAIGLVTYWLYKSA